MIIFFGPAGSGKSLQGKLLAARYGWRWLSAGQQLRDSGDPTIVKELKTGKLIPSEKVHAVMLDAFLRADNIDKIVLDGFPRALDEAKWLIESKELHKRSVSLAIVFDVPKDELMKRLQLRGRGDDTPDAIAERLRIYDEETQPILDYMAEQGVKIVHLDGVGNVGAIHDIIAREVEGIL